MTKSKQETISNLEDELWDVETVTAVAEARKAKREMKGDSMNLFILKVDHPESDNELAAFINELKNKITDIPNGTRIQLAVQSGEHWYPVDIEINNQNLSVLIPEAGFSPSTANATSLILDAFPKADIYRFYPETETHLGRQRTYMIQADGESCSKYALQQLFSLNKNKDLHHQLMQNQGLFEIESLYPKAENPKQHYKFSFSNCSPELAVIFKATQSTSAFERLSDSIKKEPVNTKGETLQEYFRRHVRSESTERPQSRGVFDFKAKQISETKHFLKSLKKDGYKEIMKTSARTGIDFLTQEKFNLKSEPMGKRSLIEHKQTRDLFLQKLNQYFRETSTALHQVMHSPEKMQKAIELQGKLESLRERFMAVTPSSYKKSLDSLYKTHMEELMQLSDEINANAGLLETDAMKTMDRQLKEIQEIARSSYPTSKISSRFREKLKIIVSDRKELVEMLDKLGHKEDNKAIKQQINLIRKRAINGAEMHSIQDALIALKEKNEVKAPHLLQNVLEKLDSDIPKKSMSS
ncbi:Dot/Icm T4SS effector [Legionella israelensis]|uniref:Dot/Icm T4SS effector n=1 Tax=Legionella israelensis TaxID=454 RepID=A0A0W0VL09_9GAMM|nr:Dot/Icm T4SS effector [Legionella israelensis]SCX86444.1 hypothetical protein SAMN02746069_00481 [Legionella israelensis DSM 19235]STX57810.1 Dot/Icm T4SS effector [Legionella israelensis]